MRQLEIMESILTLSFVDATSPFMDVRNSTILDQRLWRPELLPAIKEENIYTAKACQTHFILATRGRPQRVAEPCIDNDILLSKDSQKISMATGQSKGEWNESQSMPHAQISSVIHSK